MNYDRHVQLRRQLKEWYGVVVIRVMTLQARHDPRALEAVLLHCALEFAKKAVAAEDNRRCKSVDEIVLLLLGRDIAIMSLDQIQLLIGVQIAQDVQRI